MYRHLLPVEKFFVIIRATVENILAMPNKRRREVKNKIALLAAACCLSVCCADQTISWPSDYQENLARRIADSSPTSVLGVGPSGVASLPCSCMATSGYGTSVLTFESVWQRQAETEGYLGLNLGSPGFLLFLK